MCDTGIEKFRKSSIEKRQLCLVIFGNCHVYFTLWIHIVDTFNSPVWRLREQSKNVFDAIL